MKRTMYHTGASRAPGALKAKAAACNGYLDCGYFLCTLPKCVAELKTSRVGMCKCLSHLQRPKYIEPDLVKDSFKLPGFSVEATGKSDIKVRIRGFAFRPNLISRRGTGLTLFCLVAFRRRRGPEWQGRRRGGAVARACRL